MHNKDVMALVRACISVGEKFKIILDEETDVLRKNDLVQIVRMNNRKEDLIREFLQVKEDVFIVLNIPRGKRFDQVDLSKLKQTIVTDQNELTPLLDKLWDLQHHCHNQFIINRNVIAARMQFLNKTMQELTRSDEKDELMYTKSGAVQFTKVSIGETSA